MNTSENKTVKCFCSVCNQNTHHTVIASHSIGAESDDDFWWHQDYRMVKCCGCDNVSFDIETVDESTVDYDPVDGNEILVPQHTSYPVKEGLIGYLDNTWNFPGDVYGIYKETIDALNGECFRLAAAGFRAIIEAICNDKKIGLKNLEAKINALKKSGYITEADRNRLHTVRFMGNDAVHQIARPDRESLMLVLEIINGILTNLYIIDDKVSSKLECPIKTLEEFVYLLDEGLKSKQVGDIDILKNLLPVNRRLIKEDMSKFETALQNAITDGTYSKLELCPPPTNGRNQQYKVLAI